MTSTELALRKLSDFLSSNNAEHTFNNGQRIILAASDYDEQTLSAVAWLNSNNVDICCFKLIPYNIAEGLYLGIEKLLPLTSYEDYYVNFLDDLTNSFPKKKRVIRRKLPKIDDMLEWGVVKPGDIITPKGRNEEAVLKGNGNVEVNDEELSMQKWLKEIFDWSSVQTYVIAIHKESGKSLSQIREEYMKKEENI
ncbi:hypothetical protein [Alkalihalobacillus sp. TS-13]|uniref:hypothetical protein n=1 Tax=Alkalihalobacillus sp. TS-13 TaxID=2842455 RepID=UPI0021AB0AAD|nr:hypothetical protein [Alkalihalobacillus sp. TS-13]